MEPKFGDFFKLTRLKEFTYNFAILGVKKSTQNDFVYGELGRTPLLVVRYMIIIKYWIQDTCNPMKINTLNIYITLCLMTLFKIQIDQTGHHK